MSRFWKDGQRISVETDKEGEPVRLRWEERACRVDALADSWRVDEGWWTDQPVQRTYYLLETVGKLLLIYEDRLTGEWFIQRAYG